MYIVRDRAQLLCGVCAHHCPTSARISAWSSTSVHEKSQGSRLGIRFIQWRGRELTGGCVAPRFDNYDRDQQCGSDLQHAPRGHEDSEGSKGKPTDALDHFPVPETETTYESAGGSIGKKN